MSVNKPLPHPTGSSGGSSVDCDQIRKDIKYYEDLIRAYKTALAGATDAKLQTDLANGIAYANNVLAELYAMLAANCHHVPFPPKPFEIDPWELASGSGLQVQGGWITGSVWSVCPLDHGRMLIGAEHGGLWLSEPDGSGSYRSECLSNDWRHWQVSCLLADPAHPTNVFAGCGGGLDSPGGLYVGVAPSGTWANIPLPQGVASGPVNAMIILPRQRILVVGTSTGIAWTLLPTPTSIRLGALWVWNSAAIGVTDLVNTQDNLAPVERDHFLMVTNAAVLTRADIDGATLNLTPVPVSAITWNSPAPSAFAPSRLASCKTKPANVYCLGSYTGGMSGSWFLLRSTDGGQQWKECPYSQSVAQNLAGNTILKWGASGVKSPQSVAVHPTDEKTVAVAYFQTVLSADSGATWRSDISTHPDIHNLLFEDTGRLQIPNDGGLISVAPAGGSWISAQGTPPTFDTERSHTLPILMFGDHAYIRNFLGNIAVGAGIVVAASQDNSNLWCSPDDGIWRQLISGGDGTVVGIYEQPAGLFALAGSGTDPTPVQWLKWDGKSWQAGGTVPVRLGNFAFDATGLIPLLRPVLPGTNLILGPDNARVMALASPVNAAVFGVVYSKTFFHDLPPLPNPYHVEWRQIGTLPAGETVQCLEAHDSTNVLVGTASGKVFLMSITGSTIQLSFDQDYPSGGVLDVASDGQTILCIKGDNTRSYLFAGQRGQPLARLDPGVFPPNADPPNGVPPPKFNAVCANRNQKYLRLTFAVSVLENEVWVSNSPLAGVWHKAVAGLPVAVRCSDLFFSESATSGELYVSTYGRSVWRVPFGKL